MDEQNLEANIERNHAYILSELDPEKETLLIAAGGTAGHINPALAVAAELEAMKPELQLVFCGNIEGPEYNLVTRSGHYFYRVDAGPFEMSSLKFMLRAIGAFFVGRKDSRKIMRALNVTGVFGTGGYVMAPVISMARQRRIKTFLHEQNAYPGKSTRSFAGGADCVFVSYPETQDDFPRAKRVVYTGNPVAAGFFDKDRRSKARRKLGLSEKRRYVVATGGSLGAVTINHAIADLAERLRRNPSSTPYLIHLITGKRYYKEMQAILKDYPDLVKVSEYAYDMPDQLAAADLVICRSGAGTCAELAAMEKAGILVPYPYAKGDHQTKNAAAFVENGAAILIPDQEISGIGLRTTLDELFLQPEKLERMGQAAGELARPDAARHIAREIIRETERA